MITILGGGVAGAALAWALGRRGRSDVVVFDPLPMGAGSTGRAFGGFRTQHGSPINVMLSLASRPFFEARADRIAFRPVGYLYWTRTPEMAEELGWRARFQCDQGLPIEHPEPRSLVPFLQTAGVLASNYCRLDGVYLPPRVLECFVAEATDAGVEFRYGTEAGPAALEAEVVAICAGMWSRRLGEELGVELAVTPQERGVFQVGPFGWLTPDVPVVLDADTGFHFRERDGRLLVMGPGSPRAWGPLRDWLAEHAPAAGAERPEAHWTGYYEMTFDHHPLVGATRRPGVWASCGFSGHGVMHSPAIADCLAAMILGDTPPIDITSLSPGRRGALVDRTQL